MYFDDIYLCNVADSSVYNANNTRPTGPSMLDGLPTLNDCEEVGGAKYVTLNTDATYVKAGNASFASAPGVVRYEHIFFPMDISDYMDGYLHMWVYMENPEDIRSGYIELTSSGKFDVEEICWRVKDYITESGWNEVLLPLSAPCGDSGFDAEYFNYIRFYVQLVDGATDHTMYFDDIYFFTPIIHHCENLKNASSVSLNANSVYVKEGTYSFKSAPGIDRMVLTFDAYTIESFMDGYVHMWIYMENTADIKNGYVEMTSSGKCDVEEICWSLKNHVTRSGWNEVLLPLKQPTADSGFDPTSFNYMRVYVQLQDGATDYTMYFDDIRFVE